MFEGPLPSVEDLIKQKGMAGLKKSIDQTTRKFAYGNLKRITIEDIHNALLLTLARLECVDFLLFTSDPKVLV